MELHLAGKPAMIIEKDSQVGGLAKTLTFKEGDGSLFRTDIGPHRFFSQNNYLYDFIENLIDEQWIQVPRKTRQFIEGKFYDYPINAMQAFRNIGLLRASGMAASYIAARIKFGLFKKPITNFEDFAVANFGQKLAMFNIVNYTEKIWGIPGSKIHKDWAQQRIKGLNLTAALKNALFKKKSNQPKTLIDSFYYPQFGTGLIYETIVKKISDNKESEILTAAHPTKITHKDGKISAVEISHEGKKRVLKPKELVSSIPITTFVNLLSPAPPQEVLEATELLKWRAQVYLFITLNKKQVTDDNWIYFPNKNIPFGRIAEMKNFSKDMSPNDKTSLFVEFFTSVGSDIWEMSKDELFELALPYFEKFGFFNKEDVREVYMIKKEHVYPVYDTKYPARLQVIKDYLNGFSNLLYIGRPGRFHYTNQDHSLEMGIMTAQSIVQGKRKDFDAIGSEKEYFERGYVRK